MAEQSKPIFLDTAYVNALINTRDQWHERAVWWERKLAAERRRLLTTQFILIEIGDGLATVKYRAEAGAIIKHLTSSSFVEVIPATSQLFTDGFNLYRQRQDKAWGITDCTSFVVMQDHQLSEALTTDDDFIQAGFHALLL
ncbi:MAG: type II toxin-antitoxin system VapC family toxin, partial [Pyrinomonadaceae bacterium]